MRTELYYYLFNSTIDGKYDDDQYVSMSSPLQKIESFLECLTNADKDGRVFIDNQSNFLYILNKLMMFIVNKKILVVYFSQTCAMQP